MASSLVGDYVNRSNQKASGSVSCLINADVLRLTVKFIVCSCSQRNLEVRFHDFNVLSTLPVHCNACVTVDGTTLEGRGTTIETAKKVANRMIAHLQGKVVKPYSSKTSKEINWNSSKMQHLCDRLQVL